MQLWLQNTKKPNIYIFFKSRAQNLILNNTKVRFLSTLQKRAPTSTISYISYLELPV